MCKNYIFIIYHVSIVLLFSILLSGCNTGIESTKTISMSRADKIALRPGPEQVLSDSLRPDTLASWKKGREFLITDNKASLIYDFYDSSGLRIHPDTLAGVSVRYDYLESAINPAGAKSYILSFYIPNSNVSMKYRFPDNTKSLESVSVSDLPFLIDIDNINRINHILSGKKVWILTSLWYDSDNTPLSGQKFIPVTIRNILPGNTVFQSVVVFSDNKSIAYIPMNLYSPNGIYNSRLFPTLFSLSDPKSAYPHISVEIWEDICNGKVVTGMTKEECMLSLGKPKEVESGHDWNQLVDFWGYEDGTYLFFKDGRLSNYRK